MPDFFSRGHFYSTLSSFEKYDRSPRLYNFSLSSFFLPEPWENRNEVSGLVSEDRSCLCSCRSFNGAFHDQDRILYDKVTVLESEQRAWESSPEAQAMKEALNPWRKKHDAETGTNS